MFIPKCGAPLLICALLLFMGGAASAEEAEHAEAGEQKVHSAIIKMPVKLSDLSEGETVTPESMLEVEPVTLRTHDEQLTLELPPFSEPFVAYGLGNGATMFINTNFLNAGAPLQMTALILHFPPSAEPQRSVEQSLKEMVDGFINSYRNNPRIKNLKILNSESRAAKAPPAWHLTMRAELEETDTVVDVLVIDSKKGDWFIQLNYDPNDKNIVNHAHYLLSSAKLSENSEK